MTKAEKALVEAAIEEQQRSRILSRHQSEATDKWWAAWRVAWLQYKRAVRRVVKERKAAVEGKEDRDV